MSERRTWEALRRHRLSRRSMLGASAKAGVGAAGLALVGCGDDDDEEEPAAAQVKPAAAEPEQQAPAAEQPADEPQEQAAPTEEAAEPVAPGAPDAVQVLQQRLRGGIDTLDPQRATDTISISILKNIYAPLLRLNTNQQVTAEIAEEVPTLDNGGISADGLTYTFKLRDGLKWSDGTALVAQDLVNGAKRLFQPGSGNFYVDFYRILAAEGNNRAAVQALAELDPDDEAAAAELEALENQVVELLEVSAPNDRTVVYQLNGRSPVFLLLATMWPLYPIRQDLIDQFGDQWTDAGKHVSNGFFTLTTWNRLEGLTLTRNEHYHGEPPTLEIISVDVIDDDAIAFLAYENDELDVTKLGPTELVQVRGSDELQREFQAYASLVTIGNYFNLARPPFDDKRVRRAFAMALDRLEFAEIVREGAVLPAFGGWVPPGMPGHEDGLGLQYDNDVETAQQLLTDAGFPGGEGLEVEVLDADTTTSKLRAEWLKEQWETKLGVTVNVTILEAGTYFAERNAGNFQITSGGWGADYPDPQNWMPLFRTGGLLNAGNYSNLDYDAFLDQADAELDNDKRVDFYLQAQRILIDDAPFIPMYYGRRNILVKPWVTGFIGSPTESEMPGDDSFRTVVISGRA